MNYPLSSLALAACLSATALAAPPAVVNDRLVDEHGMTLYVFDKDGPGKSVCMEGCTGNWPPAMAAAADKAGGPWSLIDRGGKKQWAYKGRPLYRWAQDNKTGDMGGDGFNGLWHVAKP